MEEQTTWKDHSFTLLVFTGIVVLCSIFFILGMLVGRAQGQKLAAIAAEGGARAEAKPPKEEKPELTFFDSVEREKQPALERPKSRPAPPASDPAPKPAEPATATKVISYQIAALRKSSDARRLLENVKKKGFRAYILAPAPGEGSPLYRIQIGPFANMIDA